MSNENEINENKLRDYLQRMVKSSYQIYFEIFDGHMIAGGNKVFLDTIISDFAGNDFQKVQKLKRMLNQKSFDEGLMTIKKKTPDLPFDIDTDQKVELEPVKMYNYFDVDTLIAYDIYLKKFKELAYNSAKKNFRGNVIQDDFRNARNEMKDFIAKYAGKRESGFYNPIHPIGLATKEQNGESVLNPRQTLKDQSFEKIYNVFDCRKDYLNYLDSKHETSYELNEPEQEM